MGNKGIGRRAPPAARTSWDGVADWYNGWVGADGSQHHRQLAIPTVLEMLEIQPGEKILDLGAGQGVLAPFVRKAGASYTGIEASPTLLKYARQYHKKEGNFIEGDVCKLSELAELKAGEFDGAVFLLSIQDINPLAAALASAGWALKPGGRLVIFMTHPCFRIPRQSGWGWDEGRKLRYRRIDRYLTTLPIPMKGYTGARPGVTYSFHRPLEEYINSLAACNLWIDQMKEVSTYKTNPKQSREAQAENKANQEIPLFLSLRARKPATSIEYEGKSANVNF